MAGPVKEFEVHPYVQFMLDKYSPYKKWIESEGVPIIGGAFVRDVRTEKLAYWKRKDCKGAICTFSDQMVADAYIAEIDPGKSTKPQRQLYEEIVTVAHCCRVATRMAPISGPIQEVVPPIIGIAIELTA